MRRQKNQILARYRPRLKSPVPLFQRILPFVSRVFLSSCLPFGQMARKASRGGWKLAAVASMMGGGRIPMGE